MLSECGVPVFETDLDRLVSEGIADGLLTIHADNQEAVDDAQVVIIALPTLYADGSQTRSFCYVDDVVDGLIYLADSSAAEPDNLGNPNEMSVSDFADVVANLVGDTGRIYKDLPMSDPGATPTGHFPRPIGTWLGTGGASGRRTPTNDRLPARRAELAPP
jgi:hypothetical protein